MTRRSNSGEAPRVTPRPPERGGSAGIERIAAAFEAARDEGRAALMPYMMAGFPDRETSLAVAAAYADAGADLVELGVPFSDPLADGPTIHAAATAALRGGGDARDGAGGLRAISERVPVVLMVYANMVLAHGGAAEFARRAAAAGAAGAIVPDLPLDEAERGARGARRGAAWRWCRWSRRPRPPSAAPGSAPPPRASSTSSPTVGTTGERDELPPALAELVAATKAEAEVPVAVGFGIGTPEQAAEVGEIADGVIVGSRLVRAAGEAGSRRGRRRGGRRLPARFASRCARRALGRRWSI